MVGERIGRLAVTMLLVAGCSTAPADSASGGALATSAPTVAATPTTDATPEPTPGPTPGPTLGPTLRLPDVTDMFTTTALRISAAPSPDFIVLAEGYAFVSGVGAGIGRFDGTTGDLVDSVAIPGGSCEALDAGFGAAWTATCRAPGLARIDAATGRVTTVDLGRDIPDPEASIGVGEGAVWIVVGGSPRTLLRVDPTTLSVTASYEIPGSPTAVRAGLGAVWVADPTQNLIHRVDLATGAVVATIKVGGRPQFITVGEGALWTMNQDSGTVSRVDPATNSVSATIALGEIVQGGDIAVGGGYVWLRGSRTLLFQIDPATNEIVARYGPNSGSGSVAADDDAVWITAHDITTVWRLEHSGVVE
jgi:YVTN family beta-propeller protein